MKIKTAIHLGITALLAAFSVGCAGSYAASKADQAPGYYGGEATADYAPAPSVADEGWGGDSGGYEEEADYDYRAAEPPPAPQGTVTAPPVKTLEPKPQGEPDNNTPPKAEEDAPVIGQRIIIYVADLGVFVFEMDESLKKAIALTTELGGWVQQSTSNSAILRIPVQHFQTVLTELETLGDVSYKNVVGTDVSEEFLDLQLRLKNALVLRDRYVELLTKAKNVEESLLIEKELGRITEEIERMKGRIKFLRDHAAFSTIKLTLQKKTDEPPRVSRVPLPFYWLQNYRLENALY